MHSAGSTIAVLGYHKIGQSPDGWESWYYVPPALLDRHVQALRGDGWVPVDIELLLAGLDGSCPLPERGFLLTFDDAYKSLLTQCLPWLVKNALPAVVFVPTGHVGGLNEFDRDVEPEEAICDWNDLRALRAGGFSIQSHGASHRAFSDMTDDELAAEVGCSKDAIESALGDPVELISYPFGDPGRQPAATASLLRAAGYKTAFGYGGGAFRIPCQERYLLPRIAVGPDTDILLELDVSN